MANESLHPQQIIDIHEAVKQYLKASVEDKVALMVAKYFDEAIRSYIKATLSEVINEAKREGAQELAEQVLRSIAEGKLNAKP